MNRLTLFTLLTVSLSTIAPFERANAQSISYSSDDHTNELAPVKVGLDVWFASGLQTSLGFNVQGVIANKLFYTADYRRCINRGFSNVGVVGIDELQTTQPENRVTSFEGGLHVVLSDKMGKGKLKITTSSGLYSETYFRAEVDARKVISFGGGLLMNRYVYYLGYDSLAYFESGNNRYRPAKDKYLHANISMFGIYGGFAFRKIMKSAVSADGYRYRRFFARTWNFDLLLGAAKMQDFTVNGTTLSVDNAKINPVGYRICYKADRGPTTTIAEIGKMPGIRFSNAGNHADLSLFGTEGISSFLNYFRIGFNFVIFGNDRRYALKQKK